MTPAEIQVIRAASQLIARKAYYQTLVDGYTKLAKRNSHRNSQSKGIPQKNKYLAMAQRQLHKVNAEIEAFDLISEIMNAERY